MTDEQIVNFIEWVLELQRPAYDADTRRRFTPQLVSEGEPLLWVETLEFSRQDPKFYTTQDILDIYSNTIT